MSMSNTSTLLDVTGQTGAIQGAAFNTKAKDGEYIEVAVDITVGTASLTIEGRNTPVGQWKPLWSTSATDTSLVQRMPQMRANVTAATGATVKAGTGVPVRG